MVGEISKKKKQALFEFTSVFRMTKHEPQIGVS